MKGEGIWWLVLIKFRRAGKREGELGLGTREGRIGGGKVEGRRRKVG